MPVPPIAGEAGGFEAEDGADESLAELADEALESQARPSPLAERPRSSSMTVTSWKP